MYSLRTPNGEKIFEPKCVLLGHSELLFGSDWLTEGSVLSGSRDKSVKLWDVEKHLHSAETYTYDTVPAVRCSDSRKVHRDKVRAVRCNRTTNHGATLGAEGVVKIWQAGQGRLDEVRSVGLKDCRELVCLGAGDYDSSQY